LKEQIRQHNTFRTIFVNLLYHWSINMNTRKKGEFYGEHKKVLTYPGIVITDTAYTLDHVDWHYHEHAYFTFLLKGALLEINKKGTHTLTPGSLLFHHWQDAHYNVKPPGYAQGFHLELEQSWFDRHQVDTTAFAGNRLLDNPAITNLFAKLHRETTLGSDASPLAIQGLVLQIVGELTRATPSEKQRPLWIDRVREMLHDRFAENISLDLLAKEVDVHPVHLSREFPRHFNTTFGEYVRALRVARSLTLLAQRHVSIAEVAYTCGFADQSHYIRCFRETHGVTPALYRKQVAG